MTLTEAEGVRVANRAWEALFSAQVALLRRFAADDIWEEVSMREYDVLYTLAKAKTGLRLADLNRGVLLSQPALSRMVDRLSARGLVIRTADPADGRGTIVALTKVGAETWRRVGRRHAAAVASAMTEALTPDELTTLEDLCLALATPRSPR